MIENGISLGLFSSSWSLLFYLLLKILKVNKSQNGIGIKILISGFISGFLSNYFTKSIGWSMSLYFLIRSLSSLHSFQKNNVINIFNNYNKKKR
jgi:hypothetical protein